jgi:tetratricopeptide (TPR) repeat protein
MIQPLHASRIQWVLDWVHLTEPVRAPEGIMLPTCLFVLSDASEPLLGQEILRELDQRRAESLLARLFSERGTPHQIFIPESDEWDARAWKSFGHEMQCEIRIVKQSERNIPQLLAMTRRVKNDIARVMVEACGPLEGNPNASEIALALVENLSQIQSRSKRLATLQRALEIDSDCARAWLELGDMHYQEGEFQKALEIFEKLDKNESARLKGKHPQWWADSDTRPFLRALYGQMLVHWQTGHFGEAADAAGRLLDINPVDNQGVRFFLPMLHLLADHPEEALAFFDHYETAYPKDYEEPAFLFGWGLCCGMADDEQKALDKYRQGMLRNIYITPMLLDLPEPPRDLWHPNDRSELHYANEFCDSYAGLWDRDTAQLRLLREAYGQSAGKLATLIDLRKRMGEVQDQRYDPDHSARWKSLLEEEKTLFGEPGDARR